ncbi:hypothetical protein A5886_002622 [Enterococcus sp. 8G7_MSG3316]|uniref:Lipoyl-binding domain-containing protein n=1 Tax=Candidatus Enterococcus testudinis TaxID=1834191 RepID=A0A242A9A0_9ENTE|nr:acetyl-CoA carboxylase biotin carboxyl carrier protein subunit [Enterococcus sp. 8G7_MSG3316]OTN77522.1 hypothetical protein A5886_002622 [Enterococcus sp. 8G7_MSG3316]
MLRKFKIAIDGKEYLVEMEEIGAPQQPVVPQASAPVTAVAEPEAPVAATPVTPAAPVPTDGEAIHSPMPGTILKVLVNVGDSIEENQPLMILEAMKMENEIVASKSGVVVAIQVNPGDIVNPGDALITIG